MGFADLHVTTTQCSNLTIGGAFGPGTWIDFSSTTGNWVTKVVVESADRWVGARYRFTVAVGYRPLAKNDLPIARPTGIYYKSRADLRRTLTSIPT